MNKCLEQYHRMYRWHERFKSINEKREHSKDTAYYEDEIYAFFINCYHLKDWIINDPELKISAKQVEDFINDSEPLSVCHDICNGLKHLELKNPKIDKNIQFGSKRFQLYIQVPSPIIKIDFEIRAGDKTYDSFTLATKCIGEWEKFFHIHKLL